MQQDKIKTAFDFKMKVNMLSKLKEDLVKK